MNCSISISLVGRWGSKKWRNTQNDYQVESPMNFLQVRLIRKCAELEVFCTIWGSWSFIGVEQHKSWLSRVEEKSRHCNALLIKTKHIIGVLVTCSEAKRGSRRGSRKGKKTGVELNGQLSRATLFRGKHVVSFSRHKLFHSCWLSWCSIFKAAIYSQHTTLGFRDIFSLFHSFFISLLLRLVRGKRQLLHSPQNHEIFSTLLRVSSLVYTRVCYRACRSSQLMGTAAH